MVKVNHTAQAAGLEMMLLTKISVNCRQHRHLIKNKDMHVSKTCQNTVYQNIGIPFK
jgi:hypothetical protein